MSLPLGVAAAGLSLAALVLAHRYATPGPEVRADDPGLQRQGALWTYAGQPLTGAIVEVDVDGSRTRRELRDGRPHGVEQSRYAGGALKALRYYEDGVRVGLHVGWWPNGQLAYERSFSAGLSEGPSRTWHANGRLFEEHHYAAGQEAGPQKLWFEDGSLRANYEVRDGRRFGTIGSKPCATSPHELAAAGMS